MWLDLLPIEVQSKLARFVSKGYLLKWAYILSKLDLKWAQLVWNAAQWKVSETFSLKEKTDAQLEALEEAGDEAHGEHEKLRVLIRQFAKCLGCNFLFVFMKYPEYACQVLSNMDVYFVRIPLIIRLVDSVMVSSTIRRLILMVNPPTVNSIDEDRLEGIFNRLATLSLETLIIDGRFVNRTNISKETSFLTALAAACAVFTSTASPSCSLFWAIRCGPIHGNDPPNIRDPFWRIIETLPSEANLQLSYAPPVELLDKLCSFASVCLCSPLNSCKEVCQAGHALKLYRDEVRSCLSPNAEHRVSLHSLPFCTNLESLHISGCWHLLADIPPVVESMGSLRQLMIEICPKKSPRSKNDECTVNTACLPRFAESIGHLEEVAVQVHYATSCGFIEVLKFIGAKLKEVFLRLVFDSVSELMNCIEEMLFTLHKCNPNFRHIDCAVYHRPMEVSDVAQVRRIHILASKIDDKHPEIRCTSWISELVRSLSRHVPVPTD